MWKLKDCVWHTTVVDEIDSRLATVSTVKNYSLIIGSTLEGINITNQKSILKELIIFSLFSHYLLAVH